MFGTDEYVSENSNVSSALETPYSSPLQLVPQVSTISPTNSDISFHGQQREPRLQIINQPLNARFRYKTERESGTHGSIRGEALGSNSGRSYPTVELINFTEKAKIKCSLVQKDNDDEHPHSLHEEEVQDEDRQIAAVVPAEGHYTVCFPGLGIIHRPKREISMWAYGRLQSDGWGRELNDDELMEHSRALAKKIDLNVVRLKFSAHNFDTDALICSPVYSRPILNLKSVATNQLAIEYHMPASGFAKGGDDMVFLTSKVSKTNIRVRFYELNKDGDVVWQTQVNILPPNVHHQSAIVFGIPPYRDLNITDKVKVYMQLLRPNDGAVSESREFYYRPDSYTVRRKKARLNNTQMPTPTHTPGNSVSSTSNMNTPRSANADSGNIQILENIVFQKPVPTHIGTMDISTASNTSVPRRANITGSLGQITQESQYVTYASTAGVSMPQGSISEAGNLFDKLSTVQSESQANTQLQLSGTDPLLSSAVEYGDSTLQLERMNETSQQPTAYIWSSSPASQPSNISSVDSHIPVEPSVGENIVEDYYVITHDEQSYENDPSLALYNDPMFSQTSEEYCREMNEPNFLNYLSELESLRKEDLELTPDSGRGKHEASSSRRSDLNTPPQLVKQKPTYKPDDALEAKALLKEICNMFKANPDKKKADIRNNLEKLFNLRLSNGDTFLHMTLLNNPPSFEAVIKIIDAVNMNQLLNLVNDMHQTILHLACATERLSIVTFLVERGCNPMTRDSDGNTAIHLAAMYETCMEPLVDAMRRNNVEFDLDAYNHKKQTPLHVAVVHSQAFSVLHLLAAGASAAKADSVGRTPLHLAAAKSQVDIVGAILHYDKGELDAVDDRGWTALQIACSAEVTNDSLRVITLLLENGANPTTHKLGTTSVPVLGLRQPQIRVILEKFNVLVPDSDSEDEYESANEGDSEDDVASQLEDLKLD